MENMKSKCGINSFLVRALQYMSNCDMCQEITMKKDMKQIIVYNLSKAHERYICMDCFNNLNIM